MKKILVCLLSCILVCGCGSTTEVGDSTEGGEVSAEIISEEKAEVSKEENIDPVEKLKEINNWYVGDVWNNFVDFASYKKDGKDCTGSDIDIEFAYEKFLKSYELKDEYDSYIESLDDEYSEIKDTWLKMKEQIELIYIDLETNGVENDGSSLQLDYLNQYGSYFWDLVYGLE